MLIRLSLPSVCLMAEISALRKEILITQMKKQQVPQVSELNTRMKVAY